MPPGNRHPAAYITPPVFYDKMRINQLFKGAVIKSGSTGLIGHVEGFGINEYKELTVDVSWCDGTRSFTHNTNCFPADM